MTQCDVNTDLVHVFSMHMCKDLLKTGLFENNTKMKSCMLITNVLNVGLSININVQPSVPSFSFCFFFVVLGPTKNS